MCLQTGLHRPLLLLICTALLKVPPSSLMQALHSTSADMLCRPLLLLIWAAAGQASAGHTSCSAQA